MSILETYPRERWACGRNWIYSLRTLIFPSWPVYFFGRFSFAFLGEKHKVFICNTKYHNVLKYGKSFLDFFFYLIITAITPVVSRMYQRLPNRFTYPNYTDLHTTTFGNGCYYYRCFIDKKTGAGDVSNLFKLTSLIRSRARTQM